MSVFFALSGILSFLFPPFLAGSGAFLPEDAGFCGGALEFSLVADFDMVFEFLLAATGSGFLEADFG